MVELRKHPVCDIKNCDKLRAVEVTSENIQGEKVGLCLEHARVIFGGHEEVSMSIKRQETLCDPT